ncbi:MAG: phospholipase, partial [Actinomycetota bacterium]
FFTISDDFGNDDHPHADLRLGQTFLSDVIEAFVTSPNYHESAMVVTYDEWGGFYDHVTPPRVADDRGTPGDPGGLEDFGQLGYRIPSSIISPWTRGGGAVDHTTYEHASVVRFIQDNWNLPNLTLRSASTNSIEHAFGGFAHRNDDTSFVPYAAPLAVTVESGQAAFNQFIEDVSEDPTGVSPLSTPTSPVPTTDGSSLKDLRDIGWMDKFGIRTDWKLVDSFSHARPELLGPRVPAVTLP